MDIEGNKAGTNGGGVRATFGADVLLDDCALRKNEANVRSTEVSTKFTLSRNGGGAIAARNARIEIRRATIENNIAHGFAGGAIYFIAADYDDNAETVAEIAHGKRFEKILKENYKFNKAELIITGRPAETESGSRTFIRNNEAWGLACYEDVCRPPNEGFKLGGAGGALYALGSADLGIPVHVSMDHVEISTNPANHRDVNQRAEMVFRDVDRVEIGNETIEKHPKNKFMITLMNVGTVDLGTSNTKARHAAEIHEE